MSGLPHFSNEEKHRMIDRWEALAHKWLDGKETPEEREDLRRLSLILPRLLHVSLWARFFWWLIRVRLRLRF